MFKLINNSIPANFSITKTSESLTKKSLKRLYRNPAAMGSVVVLIFILIASVFGHWIIEHELDTVFWDYLQSPPTWENGLIFGTDSNGRDMLIRTLYGGRISLSVAAVATLVALFVGVSYGAIAGFFGGKVDAFMMRLVDIIYSLPFMFLVILLVVLFGRSIVLIYVGIGLVEWLDMARIVRGQTLSLKHKEFVSAAEAMGVSDMQIIFSHIIPNVASPVLVYITLSIPRVIILESFISFLGLGVQEPETSWGVLISEGAKLVEVAPWMVIYPSIFLVVCILAFNFLGDGLRDAFDPKQ